MPRQSFVAQVEAEHRFTANRRKSTLDQRISLAEAVGAETDEVTAPFTTEIAPTDMRQLALVAHNHMKPAMKAFIETYSEILKKFRITGTQTTMKMCKSIWGEDDDITYGLTCTSGPLGGDAQIAALMCIEDLGGLIFFVDPLSAHPHQADIDSLIRLANCGNIVVCNNPASASSMMHTLRCALLKGGNSARGMIPSFFETLESPAVEEYKNHQAMALANVIKGRSPSANPPAEVAPPQAPKEDLDFQKKVSFGEDAVEPQLANMDISETAIDRALMLQSRAFSTDRLVGMMEDDSHDESSDSDDETGELDNFDDNIEETRTRANRVSMNLYGIKTAEAKKNKKERSKARKVGKGITKMLRKFSG